MTRRPYNPGEPLGLPRGTVRSVIAIMVTTAAICLAFAGQLGGEFATITGVVVAFYFSSRQGAAPSPTPTGLVITARREPA